MRFSIKVRKVEELRIRLDHAHRKMEAKKRREKEQRMRLLRAKSSARIALADSADARVDIFFAAAVHAAGAAASTS